jgi:hypothetical protein
MVSFQQLLAELRQFATSTRDLGDRFERLMKAYLQTDPMKLKNGLKDKQGRI